MALHGASGSLHRCVTCLRQPRPAELAASRSANHPQISEIRRNPPRRTRPKTGFEAVLFDRHPRPAESILGALPRCSRSCRPTSATSSSPDSSRWTCILVQRCCRRLRRAVDEYIRQLPCSALELQRRGVVADGEYHLGWVLGSRWKIAVNVYCHAMGTDDPKGFLTLVRTGPWDNYSLFNAGRHGRRQRRDHGVREDPAGDADAHRRGATDNLPRLHVLEVPLGRWW